MLQAIWAQDQNGLIGKDDQMPWHLPSDLAYFKKLTSGNTLIMGRKTFVGMGSRPLPNRQTVILSRNEEYNPAGVTVLHSVEEVLHLVNKQTTPVFIAGGAMLYQTFLPYCDVLYRTVIEASFSGDTYFPKVDWFQWQLVKETVGTIDEKNRYPHRFEVYHRK